MLCGSGWPPAALTQAPHHCMVAFFKHRFALSPLTAQNGNALASL